MDVRGILTGVFRGVFDDKKMELHDHLSAKDVKGWDSLIQIQLLAGVEKAFGIRFSIKEVMSLNDVGSFVHLVEKKIDNKQGIHVER